MITGTITGLRAIENHDLEQLLEWRNEPKLRRYFREYRELNYEHQKKWFESINENASNNLMFSIVDLQKNLIGAAGLCSINYKSRNAEISIYIGKDTLYIDNKFAPDAIKTLVDYGFNELGLHRLWAEVYDFDEQKKNVLISLGFTLEGTLQETYWQKGTWNHSLLFGLLEK